MAARRGKSQARRNHAPNGLPGWAWMVLGVVLTVAVVMLVPKWLKSDRDGLWRPQPNPNARPAPVVDAADDIPQGGAEHAARQRQESGANPDEGPDYDFYTLLPGKEVELSDAELAATARAEAQREAQREAQLAQSILDATELPAPVSDKPVVPTPAPAARVATAATDGSSYVLQAGAFQASAQAEELKARIAMLGLGARVESAEIDGKSIHRVRTGPYSSASDLADAKRKLAEGGLPAMAIKVQ